MCGNTEEQIAITRKCRAWKASMLIGCMLGAILICVRGDHNLKEMRCGNDGRGKFMTRIINNGLYMFCCLIGVSCYQFIYTVAPAIIALKRAGFS